jgi:hypothetical protein
VASSDPLNHFLEELLPRDAKVLRHVPKSLRQSARWLAIGSGMALLLVWNGRLVAATGAGLGTMWLVYSLRDSAWRAAIVDLVNLMEGLNQRLILAVLGGSGATLGTYIALSIWLEAQSHWMAVGMILQGTATMGALGFLLWQRLNAPIGKSKIMPVRDIVPPAIDLSQPLQDLTDNDPLKRLIAVRQLNQHLPNLGNQQADVLEYYRILFRRETDILVREAILDGFQIVEGNVPSNSQPSQRMMSPAPQTEAFTPGMRLGQFAPEIEEAELIEYSPAPTLPKHLAAKAFEDNWQHN